MAWCMPAPPAQPRFRSLWERYCRGVQAIVFVVDSADMDAMEAARAELHSLLEKPSLRGTPLLLLGNKNDLPGALTSQQLITRLDLKVRGWGGRRRRGFCIPVAVGPWA
eukprot:359953-Chlamydomonas_euryale.AAC.7